jgi:putative nucleotidyltransferase with HDIG domain
VSEAEIRAGLDALPAFPSVVHDVLATIDDEDSHLRTLSDHLEHDPVLGARVLSLANRAHAHYDSEPVRDLYTAVSMVGLRRIRDIVARVALVDFVRHAGCSPSFWQHSLAVAIAAEELAELFGRDRKDCLVAGLLHDVGALWLRTCRPRELAALQAWVAHAHPVTPGHALERACFGMDHATIGRHMATAWHLPSEMAAAIGEHHQPHHNPTGALVAVTHLAELICLGLDLPPRAANRIDTLDEAVMGALGPEGLQALTDLLGVIEARYAFEVVALQESPREPDPQEAGVSA